MKSKYNKQIADSLTLIKLKQEETSKDDLPKKKLSKYQREYIEAIRQQEKICWY
jgi:hypothetical protein